MGTKDLKVLITGISGFAGSHLAEYCLSKDVEVFGTIRWRSRMENIDHIKDELHLLDCDIRDASSVSSVLAEVKPNYIFHLAAQSFVPTSWKAPAETLTTNIIGEVDIFEAVRELKLDTRIQLACSSEEYGMVYESEIPIKETNPLRPLSPYGVSKVAQDLLGYQYHQSYGMHIVRTRAFNHEGPRRGEVFVVSNFAKQIAMIEKGLCEPVIKVGNLESFRDFTDVRDVAKAYWLALEKGEPGDVYNIASGRTVKIKDMLNMLLEMSSVKVEIKKDASRMRPSDVPILLGDSTKFREKTGWQPEIPFEKIVEDTLNYWREKI
ncbi:GDP-mannose 4,6-dehydratase [Candidatus Oleimmundimicrobium sp.]|uniref:GDP-mannose 4,6-dehydratase n=1 Tax=Candidatus Oleimmundimicrobium sp. TaxID=3060597 RepID=UPI00271A7F6A|nr:GDP-mannose 4,6-dehydratase [Candidatus Oleimmundimicrobium sp.]MDO8886358.1 GDP-mannose 4,6-dehydratase [Candidatus Oleimmundimicrobium sp.]